MLNIKSYCIWNENLFVFAITFSIFKAINTQFHLLVSYVPMSKSFDWIDKIVFSSLKTNIQVNGWMAFIRFSDKRYSMKLKSIGKFSGTQTKIERYFSAFIYVGVCVCVYFVCQMFCCCFISSSWLILVRVCVALT